MRLNTFLIFEREILWKDSKIVILDKEKKVCLEKFIGEFDDKQKASNFIYIINLKNKNFGQLN